MYEYQKVEPGLELFRNWYETIELAPGIYKIVEKCPDLELDDDVVVEPLIDCYNRGYGCELTVEYADMFACLETVSTVMMVPDYDYRNICNFYDLMGKTQTLSKMLDSCNVSWIHVSRDYNEVRESLQGFIHCSAADFTRYPQSFFSSISPSSLLVFNDMFKYTNSLS